jgi:drug/metabolite transporter (DMT)-like permease
LRRSYIYLHIAVFLLGFSPVFGKVISLNEGLLTWYRVFLSAVILFFVVRWYKVDTHIAISQKIDIAKVGLLNTLSWVFFYAGIKYSNISIGVICYCVASFFTAILHPLINKQAFKTSELLLSILTIVGIGMIFHFDASYQLGILLGITAPFFFSVYSIYNKRLATRYNSKLNNYYQMLGGTIGLGLLLPIYLYFFPSDRILPEGLDWLYLILLSGLCTVCVYILMTEAMKEISAFTSNLTMNLEPVYAIIVAFLFFDESKQVNFSFYLGISLILLSIGLQTYFSNQEKVEK